MCSNRILSLLWPLYPCSCSQVVEQSHPCVWPRSRYYFSLNYIVLNMTVCISTVLWVWPLLTVLVITVRLLKEKFRHPELKCPFDTLELTVKNIIIKWWSAAFVVIVSSHTFKSWQISEFVLQVRALPLEAHWGKKGLSWKLILEDADVNGKVPFSTSL